MDLVLRPHNRPCTVHRVFQYYWWWHWALVSSCFNFQLVASNSKFTQYFSQLTVCHDDQIRLWLHM